MATQEVRDYIKSKQIVKNPDGSFWDGEPALATEKYDNNLPKVNKSGPVSGAELAQLLFMINHNWREWAIRVRRDILVLEKLVIPDDAQRKATLYGDPGDPPLDPDI